MAPRWPNAFDHAYERERCDLSAFVLDQHQTGLSATDLGDGRRDGARQRRTPGDRHLDLRLPGCHCVHEVGIDQERRMLEHPARYLRLVGGEPENHRRRRVLAERQRLRQRLAHQRRGIVEQHDQRALGGDAVVRRKVGVEVSARQRAAGVGAVAAVAVRIQCRNWRTIMCRPEPSLGAARAARASSVAVRDVHFVSLHFHKAFTIILRND